MSYSIQVKSLSSQLISKKSKKGLWIFTAVFAAVLILEAVFILLNATAVSEDPPLFDPNQKVTRAKMEVSAITELGYAGNDWLCTAYDISAGELRIVRLSSNSLQRVRRDISTEGHAVITGSIWTFEGDVQDFFLNELGFKTTENLQATYGKYYLNNNQATSYTAAVLILGCLIVMLVLPFYITFMIYYSGAKLKKSLSLLEKTGSLPLAQALVNGEIETDSGGFAFTPEFFFSGKDRLILRYADVAWVYTRVYNNHETLLIFSADGQKWTIPMGYRIYCGLPLATVIITEIRTHNPRAIVGYGAEQRNLYKAFKERNKYHEGR